MKLVRTPGISATMSFGALAGGAIMGLLAHVLMAQILGPAGTGAVLLATTFVGVGATLARAGLDNVVLRQAAVLHGAGDDVSLAWLHRRSMTIVLGLGLAGTAVLAVAAPYWQFTEDMPEQFATALRVLALALPPTAFLVLQSEFVKARGQAAVATALQAALTPLLVAAGLLLIWLAAAQPSVTTVAWIIMGATFAAATSAAFAWRPGRRVTAEPAGKAAAGDLMRRGRPFLWVAAMNLALSWTDIIVLGFWTDSASLGIYGIAAKVATAVSFLLIACNSVTAPRFAALHAGGDQPGLQRLAAISTFWLAIAALPLVLLLLVFAGRVMAIFGAAFADGALALQILVAGQAVNVATGSVGYLLMMTGHERSMRNIISLAAAGNVAGNLLLVPWLGPTGAALATAVTLAGMNIACYLAVRRRLGIDTLGYLHAGMTSWAR